jgi:glycine/D-amino acid oxidase-like deaminating enzyme
MYAALERWFPEAGHGNPAQAWQGTRARLPDDAPVLGPSPWPGLWLNLGHGDQGSALAGGCARLLADGLEGRPALAGRTCWAASAGERRRAGVTAAQTPATLPSWLFSPFSHRLRRTARRDTAGA